MNIAAGAVLGPYEILAQIGAGGMGEVWRARDTGLDREVAIKYSNIYPEFLSRDQGFAALRRCTFIQSLSRSSLSTHSRGVGRAGGIKITRTRRGRAQEKMLALQSWT